MASITKYQKTPAELLSFDVPFAKAMAEDLGAGGLASDSIASFTYDCDVGIAVVDASIVGTSVRLFIVGGVSGRYYYAWADVKTAAGRIKHGQIRIAIRGAGIPALLPVNGGDAGDVTNLNPIDAGNVGDLTDLVPIDGGEA